MQCFTKKLLLSHVSVFIISILHIYRLKLKAYHSVTEPAVSMIVASSGLGGSINKCDKILNFWIKHMSISHPSIGNKVDDFVGH